MRAARVRAPGSSPSHLGSPKARIMSISRKPWASLGAPSPADAHDARAAVRIMKSRSRAEAASSNLLALRRAVQKPAPTPHGTCARFAAIHRLISSFRVGAGDPAGARITSISGTPATRLRRVGGNRASLKGFAFTASPSSGGPRLPQKGAAALPDLGFRSSGQEASGFRGLGYRAPGNKECKNWVFGLGLSVFRVFLGVSSGLGLRVPGAWIRAVEFGWPGFAGLILSRALGFFLGSGFRVQGLGLGCDYRAGFLMSPIQAR